MISQGTVAKFFAVEDDVDSDEAAELLAMVINMSIQEGLRYVDREPFRDGYIIIFTDPRHPITIPVDVRRELKAADQRAQDEANDDAIMDKAQNMADANGLIKPNRQMVRAVEKQRNRQ